MQITKMHGLGNDFIILDARNLELVGISEIAKTLCERRVNVGADGLLIIEKSDVADFAMRVINSDGSEAQMCGNGIRCVARYAYDFGIVANREMKVWTPAGVMTPTVIKENAVVSGVRVHMGRPDFARENIPMSGVGSTMDTTIDIEGEAVTLSPVLMGVPHCIVEGRDEDFERIAPKIECHEVFPEHINVNFVRVLSDGKVSMRTWERGAGRTLACGTGACATAVVLNKKGLVKERTEIELEHGNLVIECEGEDVYMSGPCEYVFTGEVL